MPNWCNNEISIEFPHPLLKNRFMDKFYNVPAIYQSDLKFHKEIYGKELVVSRKQYTLNGLVPVPQEVLNRGFNDAGYDWQCDNWGTKWDISPHDIKETDKSISFNTDTAWSPPIEAFEKIADRFPDARIKIKYDEPGTQYVGEFNYDPITREKTDNTIEPKEGKPYYDKILERYDAEEYFSIDEFAEYDPTNFNYTKITCSHCGAVMNGEIYDAYNGECYSCHEPVTITVVSRIEK